MSTSHHPQTDGQSERTIQTLEDMLRACVLEDGGSWGDYLHLIEFAYNDSYHVSIGMTLYEVLHGRKCRIPCAGLKLVIEVFWDRDVKNLRNRSIPVVKVAWKRSPDREATWELESEMMKHYPHLL
ncbi:retrotransposon protein [Trifolium medium]|uniref:Retrotransposon protein n=1 Tax=Trifolium medium TaxID=97028 RepID=A0A392PRS3_9FABA|nr:retrotransposon protein [Trifolium medium]